VANARIASDTLTLPVTLGNNAHDTS